MKTVHAIYENGVFRPIDSVELPNHCAVEFEPRVLSQSPSDAGTPLNDARDPAWTAVYQVLSRSYEGGDPDAAARHNEHQP